MKRLSLLPLIVLAFWIGATYVTEAAPVRREVPVRFNFPASYAPLHLDSGWVTFPLNPISQQMHGYIHANAVPYTFDACAKLVFAFEAGDVWPGNTFACQVWLEPYDAPDLTEVRSDFGCEFGVELRERFSHIKLYSFTKDFLLSIEGNGGLPLGNQLLGGWDTLEFASLPIDELVPGSETVKAVVQSCLDFADANGMSIGKLDLMGELVVQGHYLRVRVGETDVELTQPGAAHAQTAFVYVPLELGETMEDVFEIPLLPVYNFSIWKGVGAKLTAVGPLSINLAPDNFDPDRLLPGAYVPPDLETVTSRYQQAVTQASATLRETPWLAFPDQRASAISGPCGARCCRQSRRTSGAWPGLLQ